MKALTAAEMREVDRLTTERLGIPSLQLMESAGASVAAAIEDTVVRARIPRPRLVAILCGKGNNGGDGFVVARHLSKEGTRVRVYLFAEAEDLRGDAATNRNRWKELGGSVSLIRDEKVWKQVWPEIVCADVLVDALLGTGLRGTATGLIAQAIEDVNRHSRNATLAHPALIVAVDTPSGLPSEVASSAGPVLSAHVTVTFTTPKVGQLISAQAPSCGKLLVKSIGSASTLVEEVGRGAIRWLGPDEFAGMPLVRKSDSHKGSFGHILLFAGSLGKSGAAILSGRAALYAGAGLVTVATPDVVLPIVANGAQEYMSEPLRSTDLGSASFSHRDDHQFAKMCEGKTVVALGPGLGAHPETQELIHHVVKHSELPLILDADGLNAFAGQAHALCERRTKFLCITPHPGEMARLLNTSTEQVQQDRVKTAVDAASRWDAHVILKGFHTVLASPDGKVFVNTTGNPGLAKGGSGDVLTGVLAALTGQFGTEDWLRVLGLGVYLHGSSADHADYIGDPSGLLAGSVAFGIPGVRALLSQELRQRG